MKSSFAEPSQKSSFRDGSSGIKFYTHLGIRSQPRQATVSAWPVLMGFGQIVCGGRPGQTAIILHNQ
jgi:hypothetical protein